LLSPSHPWHRVLKAGHPQLAVAVVAGAEAAAVRQSHLGADEDHGKWRFFMGKPWENPLEIDYFSGVKWDFIGDIIM